MNRFRKSVALAVTAALSLAVVLTGCAGRKTDAPSTPQPTGTTQPTENPKPYAGTTIRFMAAQHPWADTIKSSLPDFTAKTGITVQFEQIAENQLTQKLTVELTAGAGTVDVFMQRPLQEAKLFDKNGWYSDLNTFVKDAKKTPTDYDISDFFKGAMDSESINSHLVGIPIVTEQQIVYYRKDLFTAKSIKVPTTMQELEDAAKALTDGDKMYGIVMRGQGNPAVTQFSSFLYSMGGDFLKDGKATIDSPEAIKAFQIYGRLIGKYGPPGSLNMSWQQAAPIFAQGKAAMWVDANSLYLNVTDAAKSQVADKVGFAVFPAGDKGSLPYSVTSWGLSIAKSSKNQDASWEFIKWATAKEVSLKTQAAGNPGARNSVWNNPEGTKGWPAEWVTVAQKEGQVGRPADRPLVINVGRARDLIGEVITDAINGKDVTAKAKDINQKLNDLLAEEAK